MLDAQELSLLRYAFIGTDIALLHFNWSYADDGIRIAIAAEGAVPLIAMALQTHASLASVSEQACVALRNIAIHRESDVQS